MFDHQFWLVLTLNISLLFALSWYGMRLFNRALESPSPLLKGEIGSGKSGITVVVPRKLKRYLLLRRQRERSPGDDELPCNTSLCF